MKDQLREAKDSILLTEGTVDDLQKIIKGLRAHNEIADSPSLQAYIRDTATRSQSTTIPRQTSSHNGNRINKAKENALTEPIKLVQPPHRYHTSLSAARIRARSLSPSSATARKALKSPYTYASTLSLKNKANISDSGGYYLLDSYQSENIPTTSVMDGLVPRSKSSEDTEMTSTISPQDQILSQHTDKEEDASDTGTQQSEPSKFVYTLRGQGTQATPAEGNLTSAVKEDEKDKYHANISSVTSASSAVADTYFRSMNFSADDQFNPPHHRVRSPLASPYSSGSSHIESRARSPKASRELHSFSASESTSMDSYSAEHPDLNPERRARSNSPKRSASQEFVDNIYDTPEKQRMKTETSKSSGFTPVRQSKPMAFPSNISPSKSQSFSRSQSTSAGSDSLEHICSIYTASALISSSSYEYF